jgi:hypothetical protein
MNNNNNNNSAILAHGWWGQQMADCTPKTLCTLSPLTLTMHFLAQTKDEPNMGLD